MSYSDRIEEMNQTIAANGAPWGAIDGESAARCHRTFAGSRHARSPGMRKVEPTALVNHRRSVRAGFVA